MFRTIVIPMLLGSLLLAAACERPAREATPPTPDRDAARIRMAQTLLQQGHVNEAIEQLRKLPQTAEHSIGPLAQPEWFEPVVSQLVLRRALEEADSMLALTGPVADRSPKLQALSANVMVLKGDPEGAIATWASIRSNDPDMQVQVYHELATLYMMTGRFEEAEVQAREALILEPDRWQVRILLGESLLEQGRTGEALDEVQKLDPTSVRWLVEAHIELEGFERPDRAVELLEKANRAAPRNPDIRLQLARAYSANEQYAEARAFLEPLAKSPVPYSGSRETLVEVYDALGEDRLAAPLRAQIRREEEFAEAQELRLSGLQSSMAGDLEAALLQFDRALEIDPADPNLHNDRGAVLARLERFGEAETAFRRAEELAPEDPVVQENLARLYQRTGNEELRDAAIARWQKLTGGQAPTPE